MVGWLRVNRYLCMCVTHYKPPTNKQTNDYSSINLSPPKTNAHLLQEVERDGPLVPAVAGGHGGAVDEVVGAHPAGVAAHLG